VAILVGVAHAEEEGLAAHDHVEMRLVDHAERRIGGEHFADIVVARGEIIVAQRDHRLPARRRKVKKLGISAKHHALHPCP
jgi:ribosomal protein L27